MRAGLYVRVSSEEQKKYGLSIDSQITALQEYCVKNGVTVAGLYNDAGISARKRYTRRPALLRLIDDCRKGKIDVIFFTKLDRWFRSVADYYEVQAVLEKCGVTWKAIWESYSTESANDILKVNIMLSVSQSEADKTSERIKAVNDYRRAQGMYISGKATLGYKVVQSNLVKDEETQDLIEEMFDVFLLSNSIGKTQDFLISKGISRRRSNVKHILRNPAYYGEAGYHKCEPYITYEKWMQVQELLDIRQRIRTPKDDRLSFIFSGMVFCSKCGGKYHAHKRVQRYNGKQYVYKYYVCGKSQEGLCANGVSISERKLEKRLLSQLEGDMQQAQLSIEAKPKTDNTRKIKSLEARIRRIGDRYELGEIGRTEYIEKVTELKKELQALKPATPQTQKYLDINWLDAYQQLDDEHKHSFWSNIVKAIVMHGDGTRIVF